MLFGDGGIPHPESFESCLVDERGGIASLRALKGRPGRGVIEGLRGQTLGLQLLHSGPDGLFLPGLQTQQGADHDPIGFFQAAVPVGKVHLLMGQDMGLPFPVHELHFPAEAPQLPAVSPGIHIHAAADGPGNAVGKFQA